MRVSDAPLEGIKLIEPTRFADRRGWFEEGEGVIIYASQEPVWFYTATVLLAGMSLGSAWLGAQMMWYARDESRLTARWPRLPAKGRRGSR